MNSHWLIWLIEIFYYIENKQWQKNKNVKLTGSLLQEQIESY